MKVQAAGSEHDVRCRHTSVAEQQGNGVGGVVHQSSGQQRAITVHQQHCDAMDRGQQLWCNSEVRTHDASHGVAVVQCSKLHTMQQ